MGDVIAWGGRWDSLGWGLRLLGVRDRIAWGGGWDSLGWGTG